MLLDATITTISKQALNKSLPPSTIKEKKQLQKQVEILFATKAVNWNHKDFSLALYYE
jgi:hypothetical protein